MVPIIFRLVTPEDDADVTISLFTGDHPTIRQFNHQSESIV